MRKFNLTISIPFLKEEGFVDVEQQLETAADAWVADGMRPMPWHVPTLDEIEQQEPNGLLHPIRVIKERRMAHKIQQEVNFFADISEHPALEALWYAHCAAIGWRFDDYHIDAFEARDNLQAQMANVVNECLTRKDASYSKLATKLLKVMRDQNKYVYVCEMQEAV